MSKAIGTVTVETETESYEIGEKRFYIPGTVLKSKCPQCGQEDARDLGDSYLSYPEANRPIDVTMAHEVLDESGKHDGEHEWTVRIIVRVTVEPAPEKDQ